MDNNNQALGSSNQAVKKRATPVTKNRKWREIESIKDKVQLEKDLRVFEDSLEYMLEDF